ncbi:MAG: chorismate mutase [Rhodospirillales bacterium]|nr:chorismate mutase [Rhodospirillales bacterium]
MDSKLTSLAQLRLEIDSIDDQLHDLIMQRSQLVDRVTTAKGRSAALRPAREALILRRLISRHKGKFPRSVIAQIWREIIAASTAQQVHFAVAALGAPGAGGLAEIARSHFGVLTPLAQMGTAAGVIRAVSDGSARVGLLPWPTVDDLHPWWSLIAGEGPNVPRIVARLPFVQSSPPAEEALAISLSPNEPTSADNSFIMMQCDEEMSRGTLKDRLDTAGLSPSEIFSHPDKAEYSHLVHVSGYVDREAPVFAQLLGRGTGFKKAILLGSYAVPLTAKDLDAA